MAGQDTIVNDIENLLTENGMTVAQFINQLGKRKSTLLNLPDSSQKEFCWLYDQINGGCLSTSEKGKKLEQLIAILFGKDSLFDCRINFRTSTNEIDLLLSWGKNARAAGIANAFPCFGDSFICECKNYEGKINITYVGKFFSLLAVTKMKFGLVVAWEGITGRNEWTDSKGFIKKVALSHNTFIMVLDKHDLKQIYDKSQNIYSLLMRKYESLKSDINYEKFISRHEAETVFCN